MGRPTVAKQTYVEEVAAFVAKVKYGDLSEETRAQLKLRVLDSIGCSIAALDGEPVRAVREQVMEFGGKGPCTLIGIEGRSAPDRAAFYSRSAPDRAAFYNGALLRYVDFMDNYMGKKQSCHPSDNFASVLAAAEYEQRTGKDLLTCLAVAYGILIKLIDLIRGEEKGFDHTVQLAYSMAGGACK